MRRRTLLLVPQPGLDWLDPLLAMRHGTLLLVPQRKFDWLNPLLAVRRRMLLLVPQFRPGNGPPTKLRLRPQRLAPPTRPPAERHSADGGTQAGAWQARGSSLRNAKPGGTAVRYSSVTHPSEADLTFLMYLYSVPRVAL